MQEMFYAVPYSYRVMTGLQVYFTSFNPENTPLSQKDGKLTKCSLKTDSDHQYEKWKCPP